MDDLVSRKSVIEAVMNIITTPEERERVMSALMDIPSSGWVSAAKRLPKAREKVLIYTQGGYSGVWRCHTDSEVKNWFEAFEVVYWMPWPNLPK